ncbi:MAG: hypothetical protein AAFR66_23990 [Bacteroidota bacterium]
MCSRLTAVDTSVSSIHHISVMELHILADCDTFLIKKDQIPVNVIGSIVGESKKRITVLTCKGNDRFSFLREDVISVNGIEFQEWLRQRDEEYIGSNMIIRTSDGNTYKGKILESRVDTVIMETILLGTIGIPREKIKSIKGFVSTGSDIYDRILLSNAYTRYLFGTNALGLKKGEGYYQNTWVLFNQFSYGITDNISVGGGLVPLFLFNGTSTPVWGTVKLSFPVASESFHLSAGSLFGTIPGEDVGVFGLFFGQATIGNEKKNLTVGLGYGFADGEVGNTPTITLGAALPLGRKASFITENYVFPGEAGLVSGGVRFYLRGATLDAALVSDLQSAVFIPWLGLSLPIRAKKTY